MEGGWVQEGHSHSSGVCLKKVRKFTKINFKHTYVSKKVTVLNARLIAKNFHVLTTFH